MNTWRNMIVLRIKNLEFLTYQNRNRDKQIKTREQVRRVDKFHVAGWPQGLFKLLIIANLTPKLI